MAETLSHYLDPRAICPRVGARTAGEVVALLADRLEAAGIVAPSWREAVLAREAVMPTGLPLAGDFAVAVPHTDPQHVVRAGIGVATLAAPVAFRSMEDPAVDLPVKVVFALALRDKNQQIGMLQTIAGLLQDPVGIRAIADARDAEEILARLAGVATETGG